MRRAFFYVEIKTKNLLEIYPELYQLLREAGALVVVFDAIDKRMVGHEEKVKGIIEDYFVEVDLLKVLKKIGVFKDYCEKKSIFISEAVDEKAQLAMTLLMNLHYLVRNEVANNKYQGYTADQCVDLVIRAKQITNLLIEAKENMKKTMCAELDFFNHN
jgi:hypothetical protein